MPVNHLYPLTIEQPLQDTQSSPAAKYCSRCSSLLNADSLDGPFFSDDHDLNTVCVACSLRLLSTPSDGLYISLPKDRLPDVNPDSLSPSSAHPTPEILYGDEIDMTLSSDGSTASSLDSPIRQSTTISSSTNIISARSSSLHPNSSSALQRNLCHDSLQDPTVDITQLRVRSQGYHCLYPGATFKGTQKSGRNSYDVTVTVVVCIIAPLSCLDQ